MTKKLHTFFHKKLIVITIITQLLIVFGGTAISVIANATEKNNQYFEYTETMRHLEEHLEECNRNKFEMNRGITRINIRSKMKEIDYYMMIIID